MVALGGVVGSQRRPRTAASDTSHRPPAAPQSTVFLNRSGSVVATAGLEATAGTGRCQTPRERGLVEVNARDEQLAADLYLRRAGEIPDKHRQSGGENPCRDLPSVHSESVSQAPHRPPRADMEGPFVKAHTVDLRLRGGERPEGRPTQYPGQSKSVEHKRAETRSSSEVCGEARVWGHEGPTSAPSPRAPRPGWAAGGAKP
jgi:hypothetical protein